MAVPTSAEGQFMLPAKRMRQGGAAKHGGSVHNGRTRSKSGYAGSVDKHHRGWRGGTQ
jgi:hypothetical protein